MDLFFPRRGGLDGFGFVVVVVVADFFTTLTLVFVIVVVLDVESGFVEEGSPPTSCWSAAGGVFDFEPDLRFADRVRLETEVKAKDSKCFWNALVAELVFSRRIGGIFALSSSLLPSSVLPSLSFFFFPSFCCGGREE